MSNFQFKKAIRENVSVILGVCGGTGAGKSMTSMLLASGMCGGKRFVVLDTENGRSKYYADKFDFDVGEIHEPFSPEKYTEAILAADAAGYPVIVVDSMSHVYAGAGGILDQQEADLKRMAGDDYKRREACKMASWVNCKQAHKKMVQRLLQVKAHLILCFRAEEKIEMVKDSDGKLKIQPKVTPTGLNGWVVVAEKNLPYELTASLLLVADHPGVPHPIKLMADHRPFFPAGVPITEEAGRKIAQWASGATAPAKPKYDTTPMTGDEKIPMALTDEEFDSLIQDLDDSKTRQELVKAYNSGVAVIKGRCTEAQCKKFKTLRDDMLKEIERETVI